jgi:hypothetical protein
MAYAELRALRRLNSVFQFADVPSTAGTAFAKQDYRRGFALVRASLEDSSSISLPVGLWDSGAADAIRRALNAGAGGQFGIALVNANAALKIDPRSQATRMVAGLANLATMHPRRAHDLLFDALIGYDANPHGWLLTNFSLTSAYVLVAVGNVTSVPTGTR